MMFLTHAELNKWSSHNSLLVCKILLPVIVFHFCLFYRVNFVFVSYPFDTRIKSTRSYNEGGSASFNFYHVIDKLKTSPSFTKKDNILSTTMATDLKFSNGRH